MTSGSANVTPDWILVPIQNDNLSLRGLHVFRVCISNAQVFPSQLVLAHEK